MVEAWNRTERAFPREASIHALIAEQAARTPDAVAVASDGGSLTYREMDERANQLAHLLRRRGVGAETRVAICVERGRGWRSPSWAPSRPAAPTSRWTRNIPPGAWPTCWRTAAPRWC